MTNIVGKKCKYEIIRKDGVKTYVLWFLLDPVRKIQHSKMFSTGKEMRKYVEENL